MGEINLRRAPFLLFFILFFAAVLSSLFQDSEAAKLEETCWIRVNSKSEMPVDVNPVNFSIRMIDFKDSTVIATLVSVSSSAHSKGFQKGDLDFYGSFKDGRIVGMTHYKAETDGCTLDLYSPAEMRVADDARMISGTDFLPLFKADTCNPWPQSRWHSRNFTLYRIENSNCMPR